MLSGLSLLQSDAMFAELPEVLVTDILQSSFLRVLGPGNSVSLGATARNQFHYLLEGTVKSQYQVLGRRVVLGLFRKTDWFVELPSVDSKFIDNQVFETLSDTTLLTIRIEDLKTILLKFPERILHFENKIWSFIAGQELRTKAILGRSAKERYQFFREHYEADFGNLLLRDIASFLDLTPETLSRVRNSILFPE